MSEITPLQELWRVFDWFNDVDLTYDAPGGTDKRDAYICELRRRGMTTWHLAEETGLSRRHIQKIVRDGTSGRVRGAA